MVHDEDKLESFFQSLVLFHSLFFLSPILLSTNVSDYLYSSEELVRAGFCKADQFDSFIIKYSFHPIQINFMNILCIFSKFWGKTKPLTPRHEAAKIFKEKDSLFSWFFVLVR